MWSIVQQSLRTPTEPSLANFNIRGIRWVGLRIGLHESVSKLDGIVFRFSLHGRRLEIPAWMFDR
jgi:hypothetical protein